MKGEKKDEGEGKKEEEKEDGKKESDKSYKEETEALGLIEKNITHPRKASHTLLSDLEIGSGSTMEEAMEALKTFPPAESLSEKHGVDFVYYADKNPEKKTAVGNLNQGLPKSKRLVIKGRWKEYSEAVMPHRMAPLRDLCILEGPLTEEQKPNSHIRFDHDGKADWWLRPLNLNEGSSGEALYLMTMYSDIHQRRPFIKELLLISDLNLKPEGWEVVRYAGKFEPADLNKGTEAPPLYLIMKRGPEKE